MQIYKFNTILKPVLWGGSKRGTLYSVYSFLEQELVKDKNTGEEVTRIYKMGRLEPNLWMKRAVGENLSVEPLLQHTSTAVQKLGSQKTKTPKKK